MTIWAKLSRLMPIALASLAATCRLGILLPFMIRHTYDFVMPVRWASSTYRCSPAASCIGFFLTTGLLAALTGFLAVFVAGLIPTTIHSG